MKIYSKKISKKYRKWHRSLKPAQKKENYEERLFSSKHCVSANNSDYDN